MSRITGSCWTRWRRNDGATTLKLRRSLAQRAFARTAAYDAAVSNWFAGELGESGRNRAAAPPRFGGLLRQPLRYGENPHQQAAFYVDGSTRPGVATAGQLQGKELVLQQHQRHRRGL